MSLWIQRAKFGENVPKPVSSPLDLPTMGAGGGHHQRHPVGRGGHRGAHRNFQQQVGDKNGAPVSSLKSLT